VNHLDPHLRALLRSNPSDHAGFPHHPPAGFTERVLTTAWAREPSRFPMDGFPGLISTAAWVSCAVILCGGIFFINQAPEPGPETQFSSTAQFLARDLIP